jgi:hypothetical protein
MGSEAKDVARSPRRDNANWMSEGRSQECCESKYVSKSLERHVFLPR